MSCLFCNIIAGDIPATKVYEDDQMLAFEDIAPKAPVHVLLIPKVHFPDADAITGEHAGVIAHIFSKVPQIAKERGLTNGYRLVNNCGQDARQTVGHFHIHLLGGKELSEDM